MKSGIVSNKSTKMKFIPVLTLSENFCEISKKIANEGYTLTAQTIK